MSTPSHTVMSKLNPVKVKTTMKNPVVKPKINKKKPTSIEISNWTRDKSIPAKIKLGLAILDALITKGVCVFYSKNLKAAKKLNRYHADTARIWLARGVEIGDADAEYGMALCFQHGIGENADLEKAVYFMRLAALKGHPEARIELGEYYRTGIPHILEKNVPLSEKLWQTSNDSESHVLDCSDKKSQNEISEFQDSYLKEWSDYSVEELLSFQNLAETYDRDALCHLALYLMALSIHYEKISNPEKLSSFECLSKDNLRRYLWIGKEMLEQAACLNSHLAQYHYANYLLQGIIFLDPHLPDYLLQRNVPPYLTQSLKIFERLGTKGFLDSASKTQEIQAKLQWMKDSDKQQVSSIKIPTIPNSDTIATRYPEKTMEKSSSSSSELDSDTSTPSPAAETQWTFTLTDETGNVESKRAQEQVASTLVYAESTAQNRLPLQPLDCNVKAPTSSSSKATSSKTAETAILHSFNLKSSLKQEASTKLIPEKRSIASKSS